MRKMGLVLEQRNQGKKKQNKQKPLRINMESHSKQALIHTVAVISGGGWNTVKQQIERADTVEKTAAKENEASVQ